MNSHARPPARSRRSFLRTAGAAVAAAVLPAAVRAAANESFPEDDVRRYGIVPNKTAAASANTAALKALVSASGSFSGRLLFANTTGSDVYYFDDLIAFRDGIRLDLGGATLNFTKTGVKGDSASGFIHAIRNFVIENGSIVTNYAYKGGYNCGNVLAFGGRGMDTALFPNLYDRMLPAPMGNITVRNLRITGGLSGGGSARGIFMLGGLDGVLIDNVSIDGQGQLTEGIYYEFGWATNEPREAERYSSHARNMRFTNLTIANVANEAVGANGAYDLVIEGLRTRNTNYVCAIGTGEALYFRPWVPTPSSARPSFVARNVVGEGVRSLGFTVTGASRISGSYLDDPPKHDNPYGIGADRQSDLLDFVLERFTLTGMGKNYGVLTSAGSCQIRDGSLTGFQRGIVTTQECTQFSIDAVKIWDSANFGILIGQGNSLHNPPRQATGTIRNCVVAGSGGAGLAIATTRSCLVEGCRFGYDPGADGKHEGTQTQAITVAADASGVVCRNDYVAGTSNGAVAYALAGGGGRGCRIENPRGLQTRSGAWS